jgi:hypothetical protein
MRRENDMMKLAIKPAVHTALMLSLAVSLAACGEKKPAISQISTEGNFTKVAIVPPSAGAHGDRIFHASGGGPVMPDAEADDDDDIDDAVSVNRPVMLGTVNDFHAAAAEMRHFAIYNNYIAQAHAARNALDAQEAKLVNGEWLVMGNRQDCSVARLGM